MSWPRTSAAGTEDKRGSIADQLHECREAIDADPLRRFVADYGLLRREVQY